MFHNAFQVHLSPFRSPPTKVRIGDKDQRVWNDDDELVEEDILGAVDSDDFDDDYEPSSHFHNPWTRQSRRQNAGGISVLTSHQLHLDEYDLEDSFINDDFDDDEPLIEVYDRKSLKATNNSDSEESNVTSSSTESERTSPHQFQNRHNLRTRFSRNTNNIISSFPEIEEACSSQASLQSFLVSDDDSQNELDSDWVPFRNNGKNSRTKGKSDKVKAKECCPKRTRSSRKSRAKSPKKQKGHKQKHSSDKKEKQPYTTGNERTSSSHGEPGQHSVEGWISMATRNGGRLPSSSLSTNLRTPKKRTCKGKKVIKNEDNSNNSEVCDSSSDSEDEILSTQINKRKKMKTSRNDWHKRKAKSAAHDGMVSRIKHVKNKQTNKLHSRPKPQPESIPSVLTPSSNMTHDDKSKINSVDDEDYSDVTFVHPTPQPVVKRSIFTRRQHRSPSTSFNNLDVITNRLPHSQNQTRHRHEITDYQSDATRTEGKLQQKSPVKVEISPAIRTRKQPKKVLFLSSGSDSD